LDADSDPTLHFDADLDATFNFDADPIPTSQFSFTQIRIQLPKMRIHAGPDLNRWFKGMLVHIVKNHIRIVRQLVKTEKNDSIRSKMKNKI
jgi:hypothetical protein